MIEKILDDESALKLETEVLIDYGTSKVQSATNIQGKRDQRVENFQQSPLQAQGEHVQLNTRSLTANSKSKPSSDSGNDNKSARNTENLQRIQSSTTVTNNPRDNITLKSKEICSGRNTSSFKKGQIGAGDGISNISHNNSSDSYENSERSSKNIDSLIDSSSSDLQSQSSCKSASSIEQIPSSTPAKSKNKSKTPRGKRGKKKKDTNEIRSETKDQ